MSEPQVHPPSRFDPIDLDSVALDAQIARKPAPMLDLIKVAVVLTVQAGLRAARPSLSEGLPAPLVFEWG